MSIAGPGVAATAAAGVPASRPRTVTMTISFRMVAPLGDGNRTASKGCPVTLTAGYSSHTCIGIPTKMRGWR